MGYSAKGTGSWLPPYMYPSYPPPIPLWAIGKPRRKFVPYFGKHYKPPTTTTTAKPAVLDSSCSHLPSSCWNNSPYLPLPLECIDICAVSNPSTLQPVMSACSVYPTGNLPLQCIEIIQTLLRRQVSLG